MMKQDWSNSGGNTVLFYKIFRKSVPFYIRVEQFVAFENKIHKQGNPRRAIVSSNSHPTVNAFYNSLTIKTEALCDLIRMIPTDEQLLALKHFYKYVHGTAIGTKMAPLYANLFLLSRFETNALKHAPHNPNIWWFYIDETFLISYHLVRFHNLPVACTWPWIHVQPFVHTIPSLDVNVSIINGKIITQMRLTNNTYYTLYATFYTPNVPLLSV